MIFAVKLFFIFSTAFGGVVGSTNDISLVQMDRTPELGFLLGFQTPQGVTLIPDKDGRLLLLTIYTHLIEKAAEGIYSGDDKWEQIKNREITDFWLYRNWTQQAAELYIQKNPRTVAAKQLQEILNKPWLKERGQFPKLNEFANLTLGKWLSENLKGQSMAIYNEKKMAPNRTIQSNEEIPVFTNSEKYPVNSYWVSRSLMLPPSGVFKARGRLTISAPVF